MLDKRSLTHTLTLKHPQAVPARYKNPGTLSGAKGAQTTGTKASAQALGAVRGGRGNFRFARARGWLGRLAPSGYRPGNPALAPGTGMTASGGKDRSLPNSLCELSEVTNSWRKAACRPSPLVAPFPRHRAEAAVRPGLVAPARPSPLGGVCATLERRIRTIAEQRRAPSQGRCWRLGPASLRARGSAIRGPRPVPLPTSSSPCSRRPALHSPPPAARRRKGW